jgi:hypothetical protein
VREEKKDSIDLALMLADDVVEVFCLQSLPCRGPGFQGGGKRRSHSVSFGLYTVWTDLRNEG